MDEKIIAAGIIAAFLIGIGAGTLVPDNAYYCEDSQTAILCPAGISGGSHTRCYLETAGKSPWKICNSGWAPVSDYLSKDEISITLPEGAIKIIVNANGKDWTCATDKSFDRASRCIASDGEQIHLGALL